MIAGDKSSFAVEWELTSPDGAGHVCFWVNSAMVGTWSKLTYPVHQITLMHQKLSLGAKDRSLCGVPGLAAIWAVWNGVYSEQATDVSHEHFMPYIISSNGIETFDGWKVIRVECSDYDRIIWWETTGSERVVKLPDGRHINERPKILRTDEVKLPTMAYSNVITELVRWKDSIGMGGSL